ncbi:MULTISPECIES: type II toxin-antitoxin system RelB/DinJ family antitoxin [unclassified Moraxella]|uniref:type II toxin-antitoxin system RelB/DinJ family antitoxin n=1 Tax=unclassified Moraxella TaxID=2685852 RepID=UPI003AF40E8B
MTATNFNVRIDEGLKHQATEVLASYGLSPTQAIKMFFNQIVSTKEIPLSLSYQNDTAQNVSKVPTAKLLKAIAQAQSDDLLSFDNVDELVRAVNESH